MNKELITAVQSTLQITAYLTRNDMSKVSNEILPIFMKSKIDEAREERCAEILSPDLLEMGQILKQLSQHLEMIGSADIYKCRSIHCYD